MSKHSDNLSGANTSENNLDYLSMTLLASGSSGNCAVVKTSDAQIIVDAGISYKRLTNSMETLGLKPEKTSAILITHEHIDHVSALDMYAKRINAPIYMTKGTFSALGYVRNFSEKVKPKFVESGNSVNITGVKVKAIASSHDAEEPVCYGFSGANGNANAVILTDTGVPTTEMKIALRKSDFAAIESNHDEQMLLNGHYPIYLKNRILSDKGHLSNAQAGLFVMEESSERLSGVFLAHLSAENNTPTIANTTFTKLASHRFDLRPKCFVAPRTSMTPTATITDGEVNIKRT